MKRPAARFIKFSRLTHHVCVFATTRKQSIALTPGFIVDCLGRINTSAILKRYILSYRSLSPLLCLNNLQRIQQTIVGFTGKL